MFRHFHGHVAGFVVAGSEPALVRGFTRGFQYLSDDQSFELGRGLLDRIGLSNSLAQSLMKTSILVRAPANLLRFRTCRSHHRAWQKMNVHAIRSLNNL
ncbi:MAG TPA: hypothetical protein VGP62_02455 [Bryobacteraceae bacterium]|nr:hypothetical protein [Bryobacteraceae bacterium]